MEKYDVVIIGAGSIGTPLSYYLAQRGLRVIVLEQLASVGRGQNRAAIGGIRATHSDSTKARVCQRTIEIISQFKTEFATEVDWINGGYLYPIYDEKNEAEFKNLIQFQKSMGLKVDWINPDKIEKLVPGINSENLRGGSYSSEDGSASPLKVAVAYYQLARRQGVEFRFLEPVTGFQWNHNKIANVITTKSTYSCHWVINAAGADARHIGELLGLDLPVFPESHEGGITEPVGRFFAPMVVDVRPDSESSNYYFYQNREGQVVFCITPEPKIAGTDCDSTSNFLPLVTKRMLGLYPRLRHLRVRRTWRGLYPATPDGSPIVGFTHQFCNLFLVIGMCGQGFMIGPGLGAIIAEILTDNTHKYDEILDQWNLYRNFTGQEILK
ncbi:MAG TPA: FAD-binding oxidoreductase [Candidatus Marinimicrobia bacterium]|nr:FAD-binding oxidoreductase [Candidatus Neomarinimicrobiota bacterium]